MAINVRDWINKNSALVTLVAVVALLMSVFVLLRNRGSGGGQIKIWYIDLNTNQFFPGTIGDVAPIDPPSGELRDGELAGVVVHVFTCAETPEPEDRQYLENCRHDLKGKTPEDLEELGLFVGYYEKFTLDAKKRLEDVAKKHGTVAASPLFAQALPGRLLRLPDDENWYDSKSQFGIGIQARINRLCDNVEKVRACRPDM